MAKYADEDNLTDVRCVIKVGDRVIQPLEQPGDISTSRSDMVDTYAVPVTTYINGNSNESASVFGPGGMVFGTSNVQTSYTVTNWTQGETPYSIYRGKFTAVFPLRDEYGKALIRPSDKEIQFLVIMKRKEIKTKFPLNDWVDAFER